MIGLFMSFLFGGLVQLSIQSKLHKRTLAFVMFAFQLYCLGSLLSSGKIDVLSFGGWPHYAGISWINDGMSIFFASLVVLLFLPTHLIHLRIGKSRFQHALLHFFAAGLIGAFFTADLFNLFVMFEIILLSSYTLFAKSADLTRGKLYIWVNLLGSGLYLICVALIYKSFGSVSLADLSIYFQSSPHEDTRFLYAMMAFVFLLKAGIWPLFLWMPSSYPSLPPAVLAFFGVLSSKVGLYAFARWTSIAGWEFLAHWKLEFQALCIAGLLLSTAGAFASRSLRKTLAYWSMSHMSLSLLVLSLAPELGFAGFLLYVFQDVLVTSALFYFCSAHEESGSPKALLSKNPLLSAYFLFLCLCASGFPLSSGFWPKWMLLQASQNDLLVFAVILVSALLFLGLSIRLWGEYFSSPSLPSTSSPPMKGQFGFAYSLGLILLSIWISNAFRDQVQQMADQASQSSSYIQALMENSRDLTHDQPKAVQSR